MPRHAVGIAAIVGACLSTGCATDSEWVGPRTLLAEAGIIKSNGIGGDPVGQNWEKVKTPGTPKLPPAHLETTERVEMLGRRIISQNTFTGLEPVIYTLGVPESVLFHRGSQELFISEGLVKKCKTEAELAAVLCTELGQMMAEKRGVRRTGNDRDTIPDSALPGGVTVAGGTPVDLGREAEIALHERRHPRGSRPPETEGAAKFSRDLMKGAGFDEGEINRVEPLVRQSERGTILRKQMSDSAPPPKWDK
ncbi:MAG: hypothetical protein C0467_21130 [Planctomycetaceae bacterium]|nr:hypothetical protein [Planctomycetaceae bacterium]